MTEQTFIPISWVYSLKDYNELFDLPNQIVNLRVLEFSTGISSFNFQMTALGVDVVSASPLYALEQDPIETWVQDWVNHLTQERVACLGEGGSLPGEVSAGMRRQRRMSRIFLTDYMVGKRTGRYAFSGDTHLPFADQSFDLSLCVAVGRSVEELPALIDELARVSQEFRLVIELKSDASPFWLSDVLRRLHSHCFQLKFKPTRTFYGDIPWVALHATRVACLLKAA